MSVSPENRDRISAVRKMFVCVARAKILTGCCTHSRCHSEDCFSWKMDQGEGSPVYMNLDDFRLECEEIEDLKDQDYVPDSCSSSDDDEYFNFIPVGILHQKERKSSNLLEDTSISDLNPKSLVDLEDNVHISIQDVNSTNITPNSEESEIQRISIEPANSKKTKVDKKHFCVFCGKSQAKLERHLRTVHGEEREMIKFLSSSGKDKKAELTKLRNAGDHLHNIKILKDGEKNIVVKRAVKRPDIQHDDFIPCPQCLGYYFKRDLWRHKCPASNCNTCASLPKKQMVSAGRLMLPCKDDDEGLREIFATLRTDKISMIVKNDDLIKMLARRGFQRNGFDKDRHAHIRNQVREMGRLLCELRRKTNQENAELKDFIRPQYFRDVIEATKAVAGYTSDGQVYKTPALAMKLGHSLVKSCSLLKAKAIESQNSQVKADCDAFHELYTIQWNAEISSAANRTMYEGKKNNAASLPLLEDISKLSSHLSSEGSNLRECLMSEDTINIKKQKWLKLSEVTLTSLMLFNRKRQGEISKMTVKDYMDGVSHQNHSDDVLSGLSDFEKSLCRKLTRVEITGKRGRTVPIILTAEVKSSTDLILALRKDVGVHPGNRYFFARNNNNSDGHLRGSDCIRKCTGEVSLKNPHLLRSTQLRKQIATLTQVVNLTENELDVVAQYMGHDIRVHREHYRLPSSTMQVAKVAKILLALDKGELPQDVNHDNSKNGSSESEDDNDSPPTTAFELTATETRAEINVGNCPARSPSKRKNSALRDMSGRRKWSDGEQAAIMRLFRRQLSLASLPGKAEIQKAQKEEPALSNRNWIQIKNFIRNYLKKMK